jgi:hypothetical protein
VQLGISGVLLGGIYALATFGLVLIFGVANLLNLAHGEFLMLGALVCFLLGDRLGFNPFVALLVAAPGCCEVRLSSNLSVSASGSAVDPIRHPTPGVSRRGPGSRGAVYARGAGAGVVGYQLPCRGKFPHNI